MSTILKALRRLEDDEASQREEQRTELREHLVSDPPAAQPRRVRTLAWLLAIPAAGLMGALVASLLLPVLLGRDLPDASPAPGADVASVSPEPTQGVDTASPEPAASAPQPAPQPTPSEGVSPAALAATGRADPPGSAAVEREPATSLASVTSVTLPQPARAASVSSPEPARAASVSSPEPARAASVSSPTSEPTELPPVAAASRPSTQTRERVVPPLEIEISDDVAVIERNPVPAVLVTQTIWHPRAERRVAVIERLDVSEGSQPLRMREGDRVGSLQLVSIEPTGVVFVHNGSELRRRVGDRP
ncbi:MAG: hypothetical protein JRG96_01645 [Deltaproteobacteria bacterium]|nr:hypothetical protein [Deltaproteobacteria bacterium]MBW2422227.1 hypothetical protein [Deltaproteobacteria bacterium]